MRRKKLKDIIKDEVGIGDFIFVEEGKKTKLIVPKSPTIENLLMKRAQEIKKILGEYDIEFVPMKHMENLTKPQEQIIKKTGILIGDDLSHEMTPPSFVVAPNNYAAYEAVQSLIKSKSAGSLVIYGKSGVGKTHLLQATGWSELYRGKTVGYFHSSTFIQLTHEGFKGSKIQEILKEFSLIDLLLIDDFQILNNKKFLSVRNLLFAIIDQMIARGKKILCTSDVKPSPNNWVHIEERIRQRVTLCGEVRILPPNESFVKAYLKKRLAALGTSIDEEALNFLSKLKYSSVREIGKIVWYLSSKYSVVTLKEALVAAQDVIGESATDTIDNPLYFYWVTILEEFFDPQDADDILKGIRLKGKKSEILSMVKTAFASVLRTKGISLSEIGKAIGVTQVAVYKWIEKEKQLLKTKQTKYKTIKAKIEETLKEL